MELETHLRDLEDAPAIPGLIFRHFRGPEDIPVMAEVINAANAADGVEEVEGVEEIANELEHLTNCNPMTDMLFVEVGGAAAGFSRV